MTISKANVATTGLIVVDPYNDFLSDGGKFWDRMKGVAEANNCVPNMERVLTAARDAGVRVFYAPHRRYRPGDYETWTYIAPIQRVTWKSKAFEHGTWGGEFAKAFEPRAGEIVALEHWCSSGFANTDLDQKLKAHGIHQVIIVGFVANTCIEATVRFAAELGYDTTVVRDATASQSDEQMHATLDINLPNYSSVVTTADVLNALEGAAP
jgi:ureidoacrylate peracid hydrolase